MAEIFSKMQSHEEKEKLINKIKNSINKLRHPYLSQNESAVVLKINFKSVPGNMVSV
jgi:hypothetical protein